MNYVNEQNMQEILDGIAKKIGQGGGSGAGLEDWQPSNAYKENDIFVYNGQIYKSIVDFESDTTFSVIQILEEYELQSGDTPIAYAQGTDIVINDIVSYNSNYYKALYDFTCGEEFGLYAFEQYTPQELTTEQENEIIQHWEENIGTGGSSGGSGIIKTILYEGTDQITNLVTSPSYNLSNSIDNYDFIVVRIVGSDNNNNKEIVEVPIYKPYLNNNLSDNYIYSFHYKSQPYSVAYGSFSGWLGLDTENNTITVAWRDKVSDISYIYLSSVTGYKYKSGGGSSSNNYSTEEQVVGTWIDGKPLYQITVACTSASGTAEISVAQPIDDIASIINIDGILYDNVNKDWLPLAWNTAGTGDIIYTYYNETGGLKLKVGRSEYMSKPCYITIQYTKTTD